MFFARSLSILQRRPKGTRLVYRSCKTSCYECYTAQRCKNWWNVVEESMQNKVLLVATIAPMFLTIILLTVYYILQYPCKIILEVALKLHCVTASNKEKRITLLYIRDSAIYIYICTCKHNKCSIHVNQAGCDAGYVNLDVT